jgi:hypothetical protein
MLGVDCDIVSADHFELPLYATAGYTFSPGADQSAYVRAGAAYREGSVAGAPTSTRRRLGISSPSARP